MSEKEFNLGELGTTMGTLLCSYLQNDTRVYHAGYQVSRDGYLIVRIRSASDTLVDECINDAIKKCRDDLNELTASWTGQ